jgi:hypothetical protein
MDGCKPRVVWVYWLWAVSQVRPWLGVTYVRAVVGQFRLVDVYKLCRARNPFEWPCPRYRTGYGVDLTRRFWVWWLELLSLAMSLLIIWLLLFLELLSLIYLLPLLCIYLIMAYLSIAFSLTWWGGTCGVRLYSRVCRCVFPSSWPRLWSRRLRVAGVRTQVVPEELAIFGRWF